MSFFDDASLVFLPSGQAGKDGKAYSMKPTNGDGDFTFSRGSNLTATRVDSNGLIEKGRENLLLQSNQFDTTWTLTDTSVTSGQSGYDGSNDAWLLNSTTTGSPRIQQIVSLSGVATYSVYAKAATDSFIQFRTFGADSEAWFNLNNGVVVNPSGSQYITSNIQSVGNGWYRCSMTFNGSLTTLRIYPASAFAVYSTSGNGVYIQDAQLEQGLVATEYIESGATSGLAGILEDSPRFDYSGGASCPSLLLEGSRTNLAGQSEYFGNNSNSNCTIDINDAISPEGLSNASKVIGSGSDIFIRTRQSVAVPSAGDYIFSLFAKKGNVTKVEIRALTYSGSTGLTEAQFDLDAGTAITSGAFIEDYGNGWYKCSTPVTIDTGDLSGSLSVYAIGSNGSIIYSSNADTNGEYFYTWGWGVEQGSYPTSYIPNHSGGSVTREADSCSDAGTSSTFNDDEGVLYAEISALAEDSDSKRITISDGTLANRITIAISSNTISGFVNVNNVTEYTFFESGQDVLNPIKIAVKYKRADFALWINGTEYDVSSSGSTFSANTLNELSFDNATGVNNLYGNVKQVLYFPTALSDAELTALTS